MRAKVEGRHRHVFCDIEAGDERMTSDLSFLMIAKATIFGAGGNHALKPKQ